MRGWFWLSAVLTCALYSATAPDARAHPHPTGEGAPTEEARSDDPDDQPDEADVIDLRSFRDDEDEDPPAAEATKEASESSGTTTLLVALLAIVLLALLAVVLWFLVVVPRRKRMPLLRALALLDRENLSRDQLEEAARELTTALSNGLKDQEVADGRFALAWVRAMLGQTDEALGAIADMTQQGDVDRETRYLELWLRAHRDSDDRHTDVPRFFEAHRGALSDYMQANLIAAISYLHRALGHWRRRETESALHYFGLLAELKELESEIPQDVADHQLMFGLGALFDDDDESARVHFEGARDAALAEGRSAVRANLGLLLYTWRAEESPDIDDALGEAGKELAARLAEETSDDERRLVRNVLLWHAVSLLFAWLRELPANGGLPATQRSRLQTRLERVRDVDSEAIGDPDLIEGLIAYYFAETDEARTAALSLLGAALKQEVRIPEVEQLVEREHAIEARRKEAVDSFGKLLRGYLQDASVPAGLRDALRERLTRFERFSDLPEVEARSAEDTAAPTVDAIRSRGTLLQSRIRRIVKPRLAAAQDEEAAAAVDSLLGHLGTVADEIRENTQKLEKTEQKLMLRAGEFLLQEDVDTPALAPEAR